MSVRTVCAGDPMLLLLTSLALAGAPTLPADYNPPQSLAPLVKTLSPAVVSLSVKQKIDIKKEDLPMWALPFADRIPDSRMVSGLGSGFLISADGYILTNNHVVDSATEVKVQMEGGKTYDAKVIGTDERTDIALVKVDTKDPLPFVPLGNSAAMEVGDWVVAIGNPFGLDHTVSAGIISAKGRVIGAGPYDDFLQTDASINPGNSGGPLFNTHGEVIGINTAITSNGQGIGFAVPIDMVKNVVDDLKTKGKVARGWIGVSLADLAGEAAGELGDEDGTVTVSQVYADTPGFKAGLKPGDLVTAIDGTEVHTAEAFIRVVGGHKPGDVVKLSVLRDGKKKEVSVTLAERPEEKSLVASAGGASKPAPSKPEEIASLGVELQGTTIAEVADDSVAHGRLLPGDVVLEVNRVKVTTVAEIQKALEKSKSAVTLLVKRNGAEVFVPLAIEAPTKD